MAKQRFSEFSENRVRLDVYETDDGFGYEVIVTMQPGGSRAVIAHGEEETYDKARRTAAAIAETLGDECYEAATKAYDNAPDKTEKS